MQLDFFIIVILTGILATYGMLVMALWSDRIGLARLDFAKVMAQLTYGESFEGRTPPYWAGQLVIYFNGVLLALTYATFVAQYLPGPQLLRGLIWGEILFLISSVFFVPIYLREGFFMSKAPPRAWMTSIMAHGIWGLIVGWLSPIAGGSAG